MDGAPETITYTQCLKEDGTMEADITVSKGHDNQFIVIATDTAHRHVETLLRRGLDPEAKKHVTVTGELNEGWKRKEMVKFFVFFECASESLNFSRRNKKYLLFM